MTTKTGKITARNIPEARRKLKHENPGWKIVNIKKYRTVYHVTLEKVKRRKK